MKPAARLIGSPIAVVAMWGFLLSVAAGDFVGVGAGGESTAAMETCNIRKIYADDMFSRGTLDTQSMNEPVIFVRSTKTNEKLADLSAAKNLLDHYGTSSIELRSSNSYSKHIHQMFLSDYIHSMQTSAQAAEGLANETYYLFGGNTGELWDKVEESYVLPGCKHCKAAGAVIPGLGGYMSGVSFHFHGPGFSEVIHGAKRWFLYPPYSHTNLSTIGSHQRIDLPPGFHPDMSVAEWVSNVYPTFDANGGSVSVEDKKPLECVIRPGEVLFFPDRWMHATLNVEDYVFFVSVFLDPQLMVN